LRLLQKDLLEQRENVIMNILSRIRGEDIAAAGQTLPDCKTATDKFVEAEFEVRALGTVLFLFGRMRHRHGKSENWFWSAQAAVLAADVLAKESEFAK
jgi:hypothetical protein